MFVVNLSQGFAWVSLCVLNPCVRLRGPYWPKSTASLAENDQLYFFPLISVFISITWGFSYSKLTFIQLIVIICNLPVFLNFSLHFFKDISRRSWEESGERCYRINEVWILDLKRDAACCWRALEGPQLNIVWEGVCRIAVCLLYSFYETFTQVV